ncbi:hypothetical protein SEA_YEET_153 [Mycobacterium phage Yeet]|uniref:Uncharacterized protein n=2 Tax=root TaxID=1 RepID=A0AAJ0QTB7_ACIBA|nr:hypothetical protein [Acinetobacter baumannii]ATN88967.1 hypothetical protein SEA_DMPSTRDIVER_160 [Mycobacterium phage DmpstrDiver]AXQ52152.1 hypothetical protein SEA_EJIMIX_152 [Mycobacterium phage Ejimix]AXQ62561.1 hypothetical protein SEA_ZELINK_154 [Mycobacterium phage Zelink]QDP43906.1 hypothetical protein SEA_DALLAS_161 [Mycobacterium phage Dallas]QED12306.1 hypothetical protein SEA_YEET_153 [Mycobacterium phage Yeet]QZD98033.1 hypothetical protein SEA_BEEM_162 [Mycobacterium phage B
MDDTEFGNYLINRMVESDDVRARGKGVLARWLADNTSIDAANAVDAAKGLIGEMTDAGLVMFILDDLHAFIDAIEAES